MPLQSSTQSVGFDVIVTRIRDRIIAGALGAKASNTLIVCGPDDQMPEHLGTAGYRVRVYPPEPTPQSGAGRGGYMSERRVDVYVITESLKDPGGQDNKAVLNHLLREDSVVDALLLSPPNAPVFVTPIGDLFKLIPGGAAISRQLKTNPGLIVSALPFAVSYAQKVTVNRVP